MNILLTGGAGFIGSHVAEKLMETGHRLTVLDDLNDFYAPEMKLENLAEMRRKGDFHLYVGDIADEGTVERVFRDGSFDAVIHLAARAGVRPSLEQPLLYERVNVRGTMTLLEAARRGGVRKFVFASSSSIYGNGNQAPFREDDSVSLPISPYAATKIAGEKICYTYSHLYGLSVAALRFFTVYGPRQRPDLAIRKFTERILRGESIPVFGDGSTGRDYTFIDDIVQGVTAALDSDGRFEVYNLGNCEPVRLLDMIAAIEQECGRKARIEWQPPQPGDVELTCADISKAARMLGYQPRTPFAEGVRRFVEWRRGSERPKAFVA